nr:uncharacterized protein LOC123277748 [Equus asinus]
MSWLEDSFSGRGPNLVIFEVDFVAQLPSTEDLPAHPALMRLAPAFGKHQPIGFLLVRATLMENRQPGLDLSPPWNAAYLQKELLQNLKCQPHNSRDSDFISSLESGDTISAPPMAEFQDQPSLSMACPRSCSGIAEEAESLGQ